VANEDPNWQMQSPNLSLVHLSTFRTILGRLNPYVNIFVCAVDYLAINPVKEVHICITDGHTLGNGDVCCYNVPTANEVAMIILGQVRRGWKSRCHYTTTIWRWFTVDEGANTFLRSFTIPVTFPYRGGRVVWKYVAIEQSRQSMYKGLNGDLLRTKSAL
jgi:hypothetical protein